MNKKFSLKIIMTYLMLIIGALLALRLLLQPFRLSGDCMEPALKDGNLCFLNRITPLIRQYRVNDIVVFKYENKDWVARVVALENDTIQITEEKITVNSTELKDGISRNWNDWNYGTYAINQPYKVPVGHVYVLSDNLSAHHDDSRVFGPIAISSISGVIW